MDGVMFIQEIYHSYLVLAGCNDLTENDYSLNILQNNVMDIFSAFQCRYTDGMAKYYYDVTDCKNMIGILEQKISGKLVTLFIRGLCQALACVEEYLLDENDIVLDPECIFFDDGYQELHFIYYPGYKKALVGQLRLLAELLLTSVDYKDDQAVRLVYELYHVVKDSEKNPSWRHLEDLVLKPDTGDEEGDETQGSYEGLAAADFEEKYVKTDIRGTQEHAAELPNTNAGCGKKKTKREAADVCLRKPGIEVIILASVILAELLAGIWAILNISAIPVYILAGTVVLAAGSTLTGGILFLRQKREKAEGDFWKPEDFIDLSHLDFVSPSGHEGTTILAEPSETTLLPEMPEKISGIILRSTAYERWPDLQIKRFPAIIGKESRDLPCCIKLPVISRKHARIENKKGSIFLTDLNSANGTFVNGEMLVPNQPAIVSTGDNIIFADLEFVLEILGEK